MAIKQNHVLLESPRAFVDWMKWFFRFIAEYRLRHPESDIPDHEILHLMLIDMVKKNVISEHEEGYFLLGEWNDVDAHIDKIKLIFA